LGSFFNDDDLLFHYTKANIALERILHKNEFKLSRMDAMDDPREALDFSLVIVGDRIEPKNMDDVKNYTESIFYINEKFRKKVKRSKVASFTCQSHIVGDSFSYGYSRARMWSQYAEGHQGICLVFSKKCLEDKFSGKKFHQGAVEYNNEKLRDRDVTTLDDKKEVEQHIVEHKSELFFLKAEDFKDEKEFRFVVIDADDEGDIHNISVEGCIKAIITSFRFPTAYELIIKEYCSKNNVPWFRVSWFHGYPHIQNLHDGLRTSI
jgi:hypothetical protein